MTFPTHRRLLRAAAVACALLAGACTSAVSAGRASSGAAQPSTGAPPTQAEAATRLEPMTWTPESPAGEISAWAYRGCRRAPGGKIPCLERTLVALLDQAGVARSMEVLDSLAARDEEVRDNAHPLAHGLGISAYRSPQTMAATFAACPTSQMSGCGHGVIQGYFLELNRQGKSIGKAELDGLCAPHADRSFIFFQCGHGMGHGLMAVHQNHLPTALASCDEVTSDLVRESCYGGAFMENVMHATHPHQTADGHAQTQAGGHGEHAAADAHGAQAASHDAHAGHGATAGGQAMAHGEWKALDREDPQYPCNVVAVKYHDACYGMQTSAVMFFNGGDVAATARMCERAPAASRTRCFMSLGRDIAAYAGQEHDRMLGMCGRVGDAAGQGRMWCVRGAAETLVNQSADARDGLRFCRAAEGAQVKADCYGTVGGFMQMLVRGADARAQQCGTAEAEYVAACLRGAGLPPRQTGGSRR